MRCLFLDLASHHGLLACIDDRSVVASREIDHRIGDHELVPLFENTLKEAGWKSEDLTQVACVIGPGGFMSLRVAVAFANTLIHQLQIPGVGVHLSDVYRARACHGELCRTMTHKPVSSFDRAQDDTFLWLHSTKKHELFVRGFGEWAKVWPEATHITLEEFTGQSTQYTVRSWTGELIPEHESLVREKGFLPLELLSLESVLPALLQAQAYATKLLEPWYGREG